MFLFSIQPIAPIGIPKNFEVNVCPSKKGDVDRTDDVDVPSSLERNVPISIDLNIPCSELREDPPLVDAIITRSLQKMTLCYVDVNVLCSRTDVVHSFVLKPRLRSF